MKNVLIVGSGGREHALAWKLALSKNIGTIFVAPGNAGTASTAENVDIPNDDISALLEFTKQNNIHLTVIGSDNVLAAGIVDKFREAGLKIFGPTKKAAQIEWSKIFSKKLMKKYSIPTAHYEFFSDYPRARKYIETAKLPVVVKADGLALGKGVFICPTLAEADIALKIILQDRKFGRSGNSVVIEEYLEGTEVSAHAICDGKNFLLFPLTQDHKRIGEGNTGPNTGGMGAICPVPEPIDQIKKIIDKTLFALRKEGIEFTGCLFPGLMLTKTGPKVLEFNARFGDPETQVYLPLLKNDLLEVFEAAIEKRLSEIELQWNPGAAACIVLASKGYPDSYETELPITGLNRDWPDITIFHAGTKFENGEVVTSGGRVIDITAVGDNLETALQSAYQAAEQISFPGKQYRKDIGFQYIESDDKK